MSQIWNEHENCVNCGGPVDQLVVDMGFMDKMPRILNVGGIALIIFAILYFIWKISGSTLGDSGGTDIIILFIAGISFFLLSLVVQFLLFKRARERIPVDLSKRKQRKLRIDPEGVKEPIRSGKVEPPARRTASKLPIKKR
jgi:hypothetical protein